MKKLITAVIILILLPSLCFGSVGLKRYGNDIGATDVIDIGDAGDFDGSTLTLGFTSIAGTSTMVSGSLGVPVTVKTVTKVIGVGGNPAGTLADGTVGQVLSITVTNAGSARYVLTPTTKTGFTTLTFDSTGDVAILQFVNPTIGWVLIRSFGIVVA
jgi:hypothetical protein